MMSGLIQDLRYAVRMLAKSPGFAVVASLTLALAIGANSAIFSLVDAMFLRPLPVDEPKRLVRVYSETDKHRYDRLSYPDFVDYQEQASPFAGLIASGRRGALLKVGEAAEALMVEVVSNNYFEVLGVEPSSGRPWTPRRSSGSADDGVVIKSHRLWNQRFGADPDIAGKPINLGGTSFTIGGVAPREFPGLNRLIATDAWIRFDTWALMTKSKREPNRDNRWLDIWGRLAEGSTAEQVQAECATIAARLAAAYPETNEGRTSLVELEAERRRRRGLPLVVLLMSLAGLVVLVCCANLANLLLARSEVRRREMATRSALGAPRGRIVRQVLTESLLLSLAGAAGGLLLTWWLTDFLPTLMPQSSVRLNLNFAMDERVVGFTLFIALFTTFLFGAVPARHAARIAPIYALRDRAGNGSRRLSGLSVRNLLVVGQVAVCVVLLAASGLLVRSFLRAAAVPTGFERKPMLLLSLLPFSGRCGEECRVVFKDLRERLEGLPGVMRVGYAARAPLSPMGGGAAVEVFFPSREPFEPDSGIAVKYNSVDPNYFQTIGISVLRGRGFDALDHRDAGKVILVSQTMARRFWPEDDAVGQRVRVGEPDAADWEVVGVVEDAKINRSREPPEPYLYFPFAQRFGSEVTFLMETAVDPAGLQAPARQTVQEVAPDLVVQSLISQEDLVRSALYYELMYARLASTLGGLGLLLAAVGLYGVVSYLVRGRTQEIGIRMALGAKQADALKLILRQGLVVSAAGVGAGLLICAALTPLLGDKLFGIDPRDPLSYGIAAGVVFTVMAIACYIPARRATKVDPITALRYE